MGAGGSSTDGRVIMSFQCLDDKVADMHVPEIPSSWNTG